MDEFKMALLDWRLDPSVLAPPAQVATALKVANEFQGFRLLPGTALLRGHIETALEGWKPDKPIIHRDTGSAAPPSSRGAALTLGLSEVWSDAATGEPPWRAVPRKDHDPESRVFRVLSLAETPRPLRRSIEARRRSFQGSVSSSRFPLSHLRATLRPVSALTGSLASKAIRREPSMSSSEAIPRGSTRHISTFDPPRS
jgi:hypothetical protein